MKSLDYHFPAISKVFDTNEFELEKQVTKTLPFR